MSTTLAVALLVNVIFFVIPQNTVPNETPDTISIAKASWEKRSFRPGWDVSQDSASDASRGNTTTSVSPPDTVLNANGTQGPPPSTIRSPERREPRKNRPDPRTTESANEVSSPTDRVNTYVYRIKVLNSGSKTIAAIDWEYQFVAGDFEPARHRFQSFQRIKPAGGSTLSGESAAPPTRVVDASKTSQVISRVVIYCVLYSDGSANWREGHSEADCQTLKSRRSDR
jgi:hypothetical protein